MKIGQTFWTGSVFIRFDSFFLDIGYLIWIINTRIYAELVSHPTPSEMVDQNPVRP